MSSGKVLLGLLAGIATGVTLGILFAPDKGISTRKKISKKGEAYAEELGEKIGAKFNEFVDTMNKKLESVQAEAVHIMHNGRAKAEEIESEAVNTANRKTR